MGGSWYGSASGACWRGGIDTITQWLVALGALGDREDDSPQEKLRHRFLVYMGVLMSIGGLVWGSAAAWFGLFWPAVIPYGYAVLTAVNLAFFRTTKAWRPVRSFQVFISLLLPFLFQLSLGGFEASGAVMLWSMLALVGSLTFSEARASGMWLVVYVLLTVAMGLADGTVMGLVEAPPQALRSVFFATNIAVISTIVFGLSIWLNTAQSSAARQLEVAMNRVSELNEDLEVEVYNQTRELHQALAQSRAVVDHLADGLVSVDADLVIQVVNPALRYLLADDVREGQPADSALPDSLAEIAHKAVQFGEVLREEVRMDGMVTAVVASPILLDRHDPASCTGAVLIVRDITVQKEVDTMKTNFIATVSHELRTPLTSILGFAKTTRSRLHKSVFPHVPGEDKRAVRARDQAGSNLDIIVSEGERLGALISDLLDISKMESGQMEWQFEAVDAHELALRAKAATAALFTHGPVSLEVEAVGDLPPLRADEARLLQVLINLISNGRKFTDAGVVTVRVYQEGERVCFDVEDTGIGIAPGDREAVFDRFRQVGDTLTDRPQGTGLGLPICREIVSAHGGAISLQSVLGKGSTFRVCIPLAPTGDE